MVDEQQTTITKCPNAFQFIGQTLWCGVRRESIFTIQYTHPTHTTLLLQNIQLITLLVQCTMQTNNTHCHKQNIPTCFVTVRLGFGSQLIMLNNYGPLYVRKSCRLIKLVHFIQSILKHSTNYQHLLAVKPNTTHNHLSFTKHKNQTFNNTNTLGENATCHKRRTTTCVD